MAVVSKIVKVATRTIFVEEWSNVIMLNLSLAEVERLIAASNAHRGAQASAAWPTTHADEATLEQLFHCSHRLAVYGTLAPGRPNHHIVAPLGGEWVAGVVQGELVARGWGATLGYPALLPRGGDDVVGVQVLTTQALTGAWSMLDEFEGTEYRRLLIAVLRNEEGSRPVLLTVANVYATADPGVDAKAT